METNNLFEKVLKDNEFIKGQLNNLQASIQILKNNMIESQNNKNNINFSSLLDDLNISSSMNNNINNDINNNNQNNIFYSNIIQEQKEKSKEYNKSLMKKDSTLGNNKNAKNNFDDNIHKRNIKKLLKEKEVINQIYLLKENFNNYNNYNIYNRSCQENSSKKNSNSDYFQGLSASNKKNKNTNRIIFNNNFQKNSMNNNKKIMFFKEDDITSKNIKNSKFNNNKKILNSAKKERRTNSMINIKMQSNQKLSNKNKNNLNKPKPNNLRYSFDDYYHKNESYIEKKKNNKNNGVNKRVEILNYLKEINNLQNIISQLKRENSFLKNSLEKEKQKNKKFRKITEEIINYFEKPNNNF